MSDMKRAKMRAALADLRVLDEHGFGYGTGIPMPIQDFLISINKVILLQGELFMEMLEK